ncbi:hypothetical protein R1sor_001552 [Riccia sorocarpa]|uniref:DUF3700 domain-containing protein n=1 Tax=Riccia sorocarpa TaxID=122646 RepID=A0ABD3GZN5_9MARC
MLALFNSKVASPPKEITVQGDDSRKQDRQIVEGFKAEFPGGVAVEIDGKCAMAYSHANQQLLRPRYMSVQDDILCMFEGTLENMSLIRQQYGITRSITEVSLIIEIYRTLRDRSPYPADHVIRGLTGAFAFVLYDNTTSSVFVAVDCHGKVPFYWGASADGSLVFSEDQKLVKTACGKSFSPFPQGCYFSSNDGLQSFEHPLSPIKAMPRVDSQGQVCGSTFKVMVMSRHESLPRKTYDKGIGARTFQECVSLGSLGKKKTVTFFLVHTFLLSVFSAEEEDGALTCRLPSFEFHKVKICGTGNRMFSWCDFRR